jgi:hypothetical protein
MITISHRGNLNGSNLELENNPSYILSALSKGFDVEVDLWKCGSKLYLGHDKAEYLIKESFLSVNSKYLWIHCKNVKAIEFMLNHPKMNAFFHQKDEVSLTTKCYLWTFPGGLITPKSIAVLPETYEYWDIQNAFGVCTDYPLKYK